MLTIIEQLHELPWADEFSHRALDKARRYAVETRVQIREMEDTLVLATCKGSQGNIYEQPLNSSKTLTASLNWCAAVRAL